VRRVRLAVVLAALTAANLAFQQRREAGDPQRPSHLEVGDTLSVGATANSGQERGQRCEVWIGFHSSCPFCAEAALRERLRDPLPTVWVASSDDLGASRYSELVHPSSRVVISDHLYRELRVQAVPAAILVDAGAVVRHVWTYRGDEDPTGLQMRCTTRGVAGWRAEG
jgi:hypothetical protein